MNKAQKEMCPPPYADFSVILPTFNRESLITRAVDSVLTQSYGNFELIIVDDGSTDGTLRLLESYSDPRIQILQKENAGVSSARNMGLEHAKGKYVTFVDSDDYLLPGFFEDAWQVLSRNQIFALFYNGWMIDDQKSSEVPFFWKNGVIDSKNSWNDSFFEDFCLAIGNSWACAKFFSRDILELYQIRFCEDIAYGEDLNFILQFLLFASSVEIRDKGFYCYDMRHESLSRGQVDVDIQSENLLKSHHKIADMLVLHGRENWMHCLDFLTIAHVADRYLKSVRWGGKPSTWESDFFKICRNFRGELDFWDRVKRACVLFRPAKIGAYAYAVLMKALSFATFFKRRILRIPPRSER